MPGRLEFAALLRQELLRDKPAIVAVELPVTLEAVYQRAIGRLPELSVITYEDEGQDRAVYLPVEVTDPFTEALRTAREIGAQTVFSIPMSASGLMSRITTPIPMPSSGWGLRSTLSLTG